MCLSICLVALSFGRFPSIHVLFFCQYAKGISTGRTGLAIDGQVDEERQWIASLKFSALL